MEHNQQVVKIKLKIQQMSTDHIMRYITNISNDLAGESKNEYNKALNALIRAMHCNKAGIYQAVDQLMSFAFYFDLIKSTVLTVCLDIILLRNQ